VGITINNVPFSQYQPVRNIRRFSNSMSIKPTNMKNRSLLVKQWPRVCASASDRRVGSDQGHEALRKTCILHRKGRGGKQINLNGLERI
jgi:hypothetical protein